MTHLLQGTGAFALTFIERMGRAFMFLLSALSGVPAALLRGRLLVQQTFAVGVMTVLIVVVAGLFVGMVLALQGYYTLVNFGGESLLGLLVGLSLVRELGPVLAALLFAGRAGSALTAEIGLMKATDQLAAMEMMAVDPMRRVIAPRLLAGIISMPILAALFSAVGVFGGYLVGVVQLGVDDGQYWSSMQNGIDVYDDILNGMIKSVVFGFVVTWVAVFEGYDAEPTSEGVSRATTRTVVAASLAVLALDYLLTALMFGA
ncbi:MAG: lipid asymmetry maintenance ABC transporter permease subunit MlaE [Arenicellales bacterium WSBS_2016_MAG_OTU3]